MTNYAYLNVNPYGDEEQDCVTRAISLGLRIDYDTVQKMLEMAGSAYRCDMLSVDCYSNLLSGVFGLEKRYVDYKKTVEQIAREYRDRILIIRIRGHLTCAYFGTVYDIWDCTQEDVDCFWII